MDKCLVEVLEDGTAQIFVSPEIYKITNRILYSVQGSIVGTLYYADDEDVEDEWDW